MVTIYEFLCTKINPDQIERIDLKDNYIEYRIWTLGSIDNDGKIVSCGKKCTAKYLATPDNLELLFDETKYITDDDNQFYTEDFDFYEKVTGVDRRPYIGLTSQEFYEKIKQETTKIS